MNYNKLKCGIKLPLVLFVFFLIQGCAKDELRENVTPSNDEKITYRSSNFNFTTSLKGDNEVPPVETNATGSASIKISKDETSIHYKITVGNIDNVFASHFHMAAEGSNGLVVAALYSNPDQPSGNDSGVLAEGDLTAENVVGPLSGDLDALIQAIRDGMIYVNVHSTDVPSGEIRGQL